MKRLALAILFFSLAFPAWATTYYLATAAGGGSDANNGTSAGTPWLTPNHSVNCGDVIIAAASTAYSAANFTTGEWGTVTCAAGNNVAWLKCVTFDACKITTSANQGMYVDKSYWGVQGWEITATSGTCFLATPNFGTQVEIHHIILANDIANGCAATGFEAGIFTNTASVDYFVAVGDIAYNAAQSSVICQNGFDVYEPIASDTLPGTHIYIAGSFAFVNEDPNPCNSIVPSDGEGFVFDTFSCADTSGCPTYAQQAVMDNNIAAANGGRGFLVGVATAGIQILRHNTDWGNNNDPNEENDFSAAYCGEIVLIDQLASNTEVFDNLSVTNAATGCSGHNIYAYSIGASATTTNHVYNNWGYSATGSNELVAGSTGFVDGPNNVFGTNPSLANPTAPGAPNCSGYATTTACMATVIANFTPTNASAVGYGYQIPSTSQTYDPLFPQWLCNVNLPAGLVTMGCLAQSSLSAPPTITGVKVQ